MKKIRHKILTSLDTDDVDNEIIHQFNNKKIRTIRLKIIQCSGNKDIWYYNKIGKSFEFFDRIFQDDEEKNSLWFAELPTNRYVYLDDTNYKIALRRDKIKKINKKC